jgi:hypothetical protein
MDLITTPSAYLCMLKCENGDFSILMRDISLHTYSLPRLTVHREFQFENIRVYRRDNRFKHLAGSTNMQCNTLQVMQGRLQFQEFGGVE